MKIDSLDIVIDSGKYKGKKVKDVLRSSKRNIFKLLKEGFTFSNEILEKYGIKKEVRDVKVTCDTIFEKVKSDNNEKEPVDKNLPDLFFENETDDNIKIDENFKLMGMMVYEENIEDE